MSFLVRKIARAKWPDNAIPQGQIPADAITSCLRTSGNSLSTWEIEKESALDQAVLALVAASQKVDAMDVVWIDKQTLINGGLQLDKNPGTTLVADLIDTHVDICMLDYDAIGRFASLVTDALTGQRYVRYSSADLRKLVKQAILDQRLDANALNPDFRKKVGA